MLNIRCCKIHLSECSDILNEERTLFVDTFVNHLMEFYPDDAETLSNLIKENLENALNNENANTSEKENYRKLLKYHTENGNINFFAKLKKLVNTDEEQAETYEEFIQNAIKDGLSEEIGELDPKKYNMYKEIITYDVTNYQARPVPQLAIIGDNWPVGGSKHTTSIFILGRKRNIVKQGRNQYIKYKGNLITLSKARSWER
jgi:hypothetical protein